MVIPLPFLIEPFQRIATDIMAHLPIVIRDK